MWAGVLTSVNHRLFVGGWRRVSITVYFCGRVEASVNRRFFMWRVLTGVNRRFFMWRVETGVNRRLKDVAGADGCQSLF
jgi:hypothetical protein